MSTDITDVNTTEPASSTDSTAASANAETVVNNDVASTATTESSQPTDMSSAIDAGFKAALAEEPVEEEKKEEEGVEGEQVEAKTEEEKVEADQGPVPYKRFAEINEAKNQFEQKFKEVEPMVEAYRSWVNYFQQNNITEEEHNFWMTVAAQYKNSPEEALKALQPKYAELQSFKGEVLSPELTKAVENGEMSLEWAKKLAQAENRQKHIEKQTIQQQKQAQEQQSQRFMQEVQTSFANWTQQKLASDVGFKPKSDSNAKDGRYEFVLHKIGSEWQRAGVKTPKDLIAFAEKCYNDVKGAFENGQPKRNGVNVRSNQSSSQGVGEPKSLDEAISRGFAGRR